jgi:glycosyltransferase involved in cell wall biosynthesis
VSADPSPAATIGLAVIAKDEADSLPRLLASVVGAFDQVVLADTGSTDRTVEVFKEWAEAQDLPLGHRVGHFAWRDDFAAARTFADSMLTADWLAFADADDTLIGADELRPLIEEAEAEVGCFAFDYLNDRHTEPRVRLCRRGWTRWYGPAHAIPVLIRPAQVGVVPPEVTAWQHHRTDRTASDERDRRILDAWLEREPDNFRARALLAADEAHR